MAPYVFTRLGSGLNTKAPATAINDADLQTAENCRYDVLGAVKSRRGRELVSVTAAGLTDTIHGHGEFVESDGTVNRITKVGRSVRENEDVIYGTANTNDISVISYNGYAYITDGEVQKRYDGTTVEEWGLAAPTSLQSVGTATTGGFLIPGTYRYAVTFYNERCESNMYPDYDANKVEEIVPAGTSTNTVSLILPTPPANAPIDGMRIYCTNPGGSAYFELEDLPITDPPTTAYIDTRALGGGLPQADPDSAPGDTIDARVRAEDLQVGNAFSLRDPAGFNNAVREWNAAHATPIADGDPAQRTMTNLGVLANWTDHDPPPADLKNLRMLNGQMFGTSGNSIRWSRTFEVEHWPQFHEVPIGRQGGETLLTIEPFGDNAMACYTTSGLYLFEQLGISSQDARLKQIPTPVGCWGPGAVTRLENGAHLFGGGDAIYLFDGERVQEVSFQIDGLFIDPDLDDHFTASKRASVVAGSFRDKAYFAYSTRPTGSDNNRNNRLLFVDFEDVSAPRFSVHTGKFSTLQRMEHSNTLVGGTYRGELVTMDVGLTDADGGAEDFDFDVRTKEFSFDEGESLVKLIKHVIVDCDTGGGEGTIEVIATMDGKTKAATKTVQTSDRERVKFRVPPKIQGHTVSVKFSHRSSKERALYGVGFEYEVAGGV